MQGYLNFVYIFHNVLNLLTWDGHKVEVLWVPQFFFEITTLDLSYVVPVKSTVENLKNFVVFWEYMNFTNL